MFVSVSCTRCGKPFQVPEGALGQLAPCPWCQAVVTALPVSAPLAQAEPPAPIAAPAPQEPLSLDDAEPVAWHPEPPAPAPQPKRSWVALVVALVVLVSGAAGTFLVRNYGAGRMSDSGWTEFTPPDGSFSVALPGPPVEESVDANPAGSVTGGKRYSFRGWYSKATVWVAYNDLAPSLAQKLRDDRDQVLAAGVLSAEQEREKVRLGGKITNTFPTRFLASWGVELHMETPRGNVVERLILVGQGAHPRVYVFGAEAKNLTPNSPVCTRLFNGFRENVPAAE